MPAARDPAQCMSKNASGYIVPSDTRTNANSTPSAATAGQSIIGSYFETSMPFTVGPTPHTNVACSIDDVFGSETSPPAHPATTAESKNVSCIRIACCLSHNASEARQHAATTAPNNPRADLTASDRSMRDLCRECALSCAVSIRVDT